MAEKKSLRQHWAEMSPKSRMVASIVALGTLILVSSWVFLPKEPASNGGKKTLSSSNFQVPGGQRDLSVENLAGSVDALKQNQEKERQARDAREKDLENQVHQLQTQNQEQGGAHKPDTTTLELSQQVKTLQQEVTDIRSGKAKAPSLDDKLAMPGPSDVLPAANHPAKDDRPKIRVIGADAAAEPASSDDGDAKTGAVAFMPTGSMFEGVLLNGMEAPTSSVTQKNPVPALVRVKTDAVLPNNFSKDVRECFVIVSGFGVLSTERAQLRTEALSCVRSDGGVIDAKIDGYVVGEDGKVGMRGRLVSKQGQVIAQSLMVGFVQGLGMAFQPQAVPAMNINPTGTMQYQMPSVSMMAGSGLAGGISQAASSISQFYLSMARDMFPVVEVDAGRKVTIVIMRGFEMNLDAKDSKK